MQQMLQTYFPDAMVEGEVYPPNSMSLLIAQAAQMMFIMGLVLIFAGEWVAQTVNHPQVTALCNIINQNKMQAFFALYMVSMLSQSLLSTGAFEVYVNNELIHSKIDSGRMIDPNFLRQEVAKYAVD